MKNKLKFFLILSFLILSSCRYNSGEAYFWKENNEVLQGADKGYNNFLYSDFGGLTGEGLERNAVIPWNIAMGAVLFNKGLEKEDLPQVLKSMGFLYPAYIGNGPAGKAYQQIKDSPLGITRGVLFSETLPQLSSGVIGCALCHSSNGFDSNGTPKLNEAWLGDGSSSINTQSFIDEIYKGYKNAIGNRAEFLEYMKEEFSPFPEVRGVILKNFLKKIEEGLEALSEVDAGTIAPNGGAGLTNGVAALKNYIYRHKDVEALYESERGFTSIPSIFDRKFKSSLLYDGLYSIKGERNFYSISSVEKNYSSSLDLGKIVSFFTMPTLGNTVERASSTFQQAKEVMEFFDSAERERFPGDLREDLLSSGRSVYSASCSGCHGSYSGSLRRPQLVSFPNVLIPISEINTDPVRINVITERLISEMDHAGVREHVEINRNSGYVAPLLSQVWKTAPYLHNGSVPSLAALVGLVERPSRFRVGGHALDFNKVGVSYPEGYTPWSTPSVYDTRERGKSNSGHEKEFRSLSAYEKQAVIEYLKVL